jgi:hypothetical protein
MFVYLEKIVTWVSYSSLRTNIVSNLYQIEEELMARRHIKKGKVVPVLN